MKASSKILIVGLFLSSKNKDKVIRTAADQLAELLAKKGYPLIKVSDSVSKAHRLFDTVYTIIKKSAEYKIAIVPLYGTFFSYWWSYISCFLLNALKKKIVIIVHGGSIPGQMKTNPEKFLRVLRKAAVVVCPSSYLKNIFKPSGIECSLIENVIRLNDYEFHPKESFKPRLLWMRTLNEIYNPAMAVRVTAILHEKYPGIKTVMAGRDDGSLQPIKELIKQLGLEDSIELPGYINQQQKNEYASHLDIYICTNRIDNAPVSLIEMMALGLPIVSVKVGGILDLVEDGVNGLLVDLDDDKAMADSICSIIADAELGKKLAAKGLCYSKKFGEEPVLVKWKELFKNLDYQLN